MPLGEAPPPATRRVAAAFVAYHFNIMGWWWGWGALCMVGVGA